MTRLILLVCAVTVGTYAFVYPRDFGEKAATVIVGFRSTLEAAYDD